MNIIIFQCNFFMSENDFFGSFDFFISDLDQNIDVITPIDNTLENWLTEADENNYLQEMMTQIDSLSLSNHKFISERNIHLPPNFSLSFQIPDLINFKDLGILSQAEVIRCLHCYIHLRQALFDLYKMNISYILPEMSDDLVQNEFNQFYAALLKLNQKTYNKISSIISEKQYHKPKNVKLSKEENLILIKYLLSHDLTNSSSKECSSKELIGIKLEPKRLYQLLYKRRKDIRDYINGVISKPNWLPDGLIKEDLIKIFQSKKQSTTISKNEPLSSPRLD